jgi:hypothetical protein
MLSSAALQSHMATVLLRDGPKLCWRTSCHRGTLRPFQKRILDMRCGMLQGWCSLQLEEVSGVVKPSWTHFPLHKPVLCFCCQPASASCGSTSTLCQPIPYLSLSRCFLFLPPVLATQSMLYAIGLGAGAIPLAAAVNWVLKDGVGQLGGIVTASMLSTQFDAKPRQWRFVSAMALEASCALEVCTAFVPHLFLPLAALANVGKNVAWLSASATRAGIQQVRLGR